jgi:hypothetical protein
VDREIVRAARPAAIAPNDVRSGVVLLDQVGLRRPKRGWGHARADRPSHCASSNLPNNQRCQPGGRAPRQSGGISVGARIRQRRLGAQPFYQSRAESPAPPCRMGELAGSCRHSSAGCHEAFRFPSGVRQNAVDRRIRATRPGRRVSSRSPRTRARVAWFSNRVIPDRVTRKRTAQTSGHGPAWGVVCARSHRPRETRH